MPDETSVINISSFRRRFIYTQNRASDSTVALQLYGSMIEALIAGNETSRTGGYNGDAMAGEANWFNQFLDNTITTGNSYRGPRNEVPALDAQLGLLANGTGSGEHEYPLVRACVVRNNRLKCSAKLNVTGPVVDSLLEKNRVEHADVGATIAEAARNIVLRDNEFQAIPVPCRYGPQSVVVRPAEELWAAMDGVASSMGWQSGDDLPAGWREIRADRRLLDAAPAQIGEAWEAAVRAFAQHYAGKPVSDRVAETLLGARIETPNWKTLTAILRDGRPGSGPLLIRVANSRVRGRLALSLDPADCRDALPEQGWKFAMPLLELEPGRSAECNAVITKPEGKVALLKIPLRCELSGDGWKLNFVTRVADPYDKVTLNAFKVSRPLESPLGKQTRLGYIAYEAMPKPASDQLVDWPPQAGFAFEPLYADAADRGKLIYATTTLTTPTPLTVKFQFGGNTLLYVNGKIVGTTLGRGQWGFVSLEAGENRVEMLLLPSERDHWRMALPQITWTQKTIALP